MNRVTPGKARPPNVAILPDLLKPGGQVAGEHR